MSDLSDWENKFFIDGTRYNCPFCNVRSINYSVTDRGSFDWNDEEKRYFYIVKCSGCGKKSYHLSEHEWDDTRLQPFQYAPDDLGDLPYEQAELDDYFFYHHPTSFFTIDDRIPKVIRELVTEAEGCRTMNWMVGGSGALRKAIYKFLKDQKANQQKDKSGHTLSYEDQIKLVQKQNPKVSEVLFHALSKIQDMTSEELHENKEWDPWKQNEFDFIITTVKALLHEVYVLPKEESKMLQKILSLKPKPSTSIATVKN